MAIHLKKLQLLGSSTSRLFESTCPRGLCFPSLLESSTVRSFSVCSLDQTDSDGSVSCLGFGFYVDDHGNMIKKPQEIVWRLEQIHALIGEVIGKSCMLCGQVGIAGSATIGDFVTLGGRAAVRDHITIVSKVRLAANSCVIKDIKVPGDYGGFPAVPIGQWRRQITARFRS
ncbi:hypothetical protein CRG98_011915 [Punica granatum]|uniref:Uncharacterized protein n=1 Tax=Punica granatum TaxID=22663 RepID=A0A2I0KGQ7_PUNGR|nr:hypothetical protein CRG98_011915 [Punica granatum]